MSWPSPSYSSRLSTATLRDPFYPTYVNPSTYFTTTPSPSHPTGIQPIYPYDYSDSNRSKLLALVISGFVCILLSIVVCVVGCVYHSKQKRRQRAAQVAIPSTLNQMAEAGAGGQPSVFLLSPALQPQYKLQPQPQTWADGTQVYSISIPPGHISPPAGEELVLVPKRLLPLNASFSQSGATTYVLPEPQPAQSPLQQPTELLTSMQKQKQRQATTEVGIEEIREESGAYLGNVASASSSSSRPPDSLIQPQQNGRQSPGTDESSRVRTGVHEKQVADLVIQPAANVAIETSPPPKTEVQLS